jgi:hypothetical protein
MTSIALFISVVGSTTPATAAGTPKGWEVTTLTDRPLTWVAPRGWKLAGVLPSDVSPSSLSFEGKTRDRSEGWFRVDALVSGGRTPADLLARRPAPLAHVTTENGWTCGEDPGTGAEIVCASAGQVVTLVVELGSDSGRSVSEMGGVAALRKIAPLIKGVWPKGLPLPDADGNLPATEWTTAHAADGALTWATPRGWRVVGEDGPSFANGMSFNATAGAGAFSITALPGLRGVSAQQIPAAEQSIINFLIPGATTTRVDGWSCGEGTEKASGLPAIVCNKMSDEIGIAVSVRAEAAVFGTLGGVAAVRAAAAQATGFHL